MKFSGEAYLKWQAKIAAYGINLPEEEISTYYMRFSENNYSACKPILLEYFLTLEKRKELIYTANPSTVDYMLGCSDFNIGLTELKDCFPKYEGQMILSEPKKLISRMVFNLSKEIMVRPSSFKRTFKETFFNDLTTVLSNQVSATTLADLIARGYFLWTCSTAVQNVITANLEPRLAKLYTIGTKLQSKEIKYITENSIKELSDVYNFSNLSNSLKTNLTSDYLDMVVCK